LMIESSANGILSESLVRIRYEAHVRQLSAVDRGGIVP
jgi:hypothetical protein